ncbi:DUF2357 domain-containing protein [Deferribacter autotrophicus]|uniref:DUF2357 domain-containing protein n=1 Tax=Deferribacter autotrophicus TaxID=500465 RepID=A0A5A8F2Y1_9BACT|nr:DUF2357 domain-containing protein [Deferribacter autotrophicus]KAA0257291.1 DUF2357 domain-containing protein [Deferribacter autotrophicus]
MSEVKIIDNEIISLKDDKQLSEVVNNHLFEYLNVEEKISYNKDVLIVNNFCGYLTESILIIPRKIKNLLIKEELNNSDDIKKSYDEFFSKFLNYILREISKGDIIYTLSLADFSVNESEPINSDILKLSVLLNKRDQLLSSVQLILSNPHRKLTEYEEYKPLSEVSNIDANILINITQNPQCYIETDEGILEINNKKYSPTTVLQYSNEESFDTLENRFVKKFLKELSAILKDLYSKFLLKELEDMNNEIEKALNSYIFSEIGELNIFPSYSQVLQKKSGYRELFQIYRLLHLSFVPEFFKDLDMAFSLKDMATLWEYYVLVELLKELKKEFGEYKVKLDFVEKNQGKTIYEEAKFKFENGLILNFQSTKYSYSGLPFRPDFLIEFKDKNKKVVFDAKFRIFENNKKDILQNMHYYKDGLKLNSATAVCLGNKNKGKFWQINENDKKPEELNSFIDCLEKALNGIGYIDLKLEIRS